MRVARLPAERRDLALRVRMVFVGLGALLGFGAYKFSLGFSVSSLLFKALGFRDQGLGFRARGLG